MKALCITGANQSILDRLVEPFYLAGLTPAKSITRESVLDFSSWHRAVTALPHRKIGKLWQSVAEDLVLANYDLECWGWHDALTVNYIDFWAELDPNINFILVCVKPEQALQFAAEDLDNPHSGEDVLKEWFRTHRGMLNFYLQEPERCVLVDSDAAMAKLSGQVKLIREEWKLPIDIDESDINAIEATDVATDQNNASRLAALIAKELLNNIDMDIIGLYKELSAAQYPLSEAAEGEESRLAEWFSGELNSTDVHEIFSEFYLLHKKNRKLRNEVLSMATDKEQLLIENSSRISKINDEFVDVNNQNIELRTKNSRFEKKLKTVEEEFDELNADLQKERFEREEDKKLNSLLVRKKQDEVDQLKVDLANREVDLSDCTEKLKESYAEIESLNKALGKSKDHILDISAKLNANGQDTLSLNRKIDEISLKSEKYLEQIGIKDTEILYRDGKLRDLEESLKNALELIDLKDKECLYSNNKVTELSENCRELSQLVNLKIEEILDIKTAHESTIAGLNDHVSDLKGKLRYYKDINVEFVLENNKFLKLQLKQVQKELKYYFDKHKQTIEEREKKKELDAITPQMNISTISSGRNVKLKGEFKNLRLDDRELFGGIFYARLRYGRLHIEIVDADDTFFRYSSSTRGEFSTKNRALLEGIHPLDLSRIKQLFAAFNDGLINYSLKASIKNKWSAALSNSIDDLDVQSKAFSYKSVRLRNEQLNHNYEHLWVNISDFIVNSKKYDSWSFKISCANIDNEEFGRYPKLEIPEQKQQILEGWYPESRDDFGAKFELRFSLPNSMDSKVWSKITLSDQQFLKRLVRQLPVILNEISLGNREVDRPMSSWVDLVNDVDRILSIKAK